VFAGLYRVFGRFAHLKRASGGFCIWVQSFFVFAEESCQGSSSTEASALPFFVSFFGAAAPSFFLYFFRVGPSFLRPNDVSYGQSPNCTIRPTSTTISASSRSSRRDLICLNTAEEPSSLSRFSWSGSASCASSKQLRKYRPPLGSFLICDGHAAKSLLWSRHP
jgi:hypothetical protein